MEQQDTMNRLVTEMPTDILPRGKTTGFAFIAAGIVGLVLAFLGGAAKGWAVFYVSVSFILGLAISGIILSAMFELTRAKWGRAYRRLAEGFFVLMPPGIIGVLLILAGVGHYLPWTHEHHLPGGKHIWLVRGFWDIRIILYLIISYGLGLLFVYYSIRKDFCIDGVREKFSNKVAAFFSKGIENGEAERERCDRKLSVLAPVVTIAYALMFSFLGFDLIMALEPEWFSTLFGAWYFMGNLFAGIAALIIISIVYGNSFQLSSFLTIAKRLDMATLLFAFCLVHTDFFWSQYLTIWYGNLPEETFYIIERTIDMSVPWHYFSYLALVAMFIIPFLALLFRAIKKNKVSLSVIALFVFLGVFTVRFLEIVPAMVNIGEGTGLGSIVPLFLYAILVLLGFLGGGLYLYSSLMSKIPLMPLGDNLFIENLQEGESHS